MPCPFKSPAANVIHVAIETGDNENMNERRYKVTLSSLVWTYPDGHADRVPWNELAGNSPYLIVSPACRQRYPRLPVRLKARIPHRLLYRLRIRKLRQAIDSDELNERVEIESILVPTVMFALFEICALIFLSWHFAGRYASRNIADAALSEYLPAIYEPLLFLAACVTPLSIAMIYIVVTAGLLRHHRRLSRDGLKALRFTARGIHAERVAGEELLYPWCDLRDQNRHGGLHFAGSGGGRVQLPRLSPWAKTVVETLVRNHLGHDPFRRDTRRTACHAILCAMGSGIAAEAFLAYAVPRLTGSRPPFGNILGIIAVVAVAGLLQHYATEWVAGRITTRRERRHRQARRANQSPNRQRGILLQPTPTVR